MSAKADWVREAVVSYVGPRCKAPAVCKPADVAGFVLGRLPGAGVASKEHFGALLLDGRHRPIDWVLVSVGTATASLVHPREVFQAALLRGAVAVILFHNHPSGDPSPSPEDRAITQRLTRAGELVGVRVVDHVVIAGEPGSASWFSFAEDGFFVGGVS